MRHNALRLLSRGIQITYLPDNWLVVDLDVLLVLPASSHLKRLLVNLLDLGL